MLSMSLYFQMPDNSVNKKSDKEEVSAESVEEIYEPAREVEIEDLESDDQAELPLPTHNKKRLQELPGWKKIPGFDSAF